MEPLITLITHPSFTYSTGQSHNGQMDLLTVIDGIVLDVETNDLGTCRMITVGTH